jgi:nucleoside-diphosphate-sugar epimerase
VIRTRGGQELPVRALGDVAPESTQPSLLLHYAYLTKDRLTSMAVDEYRSRNAEIRDRVAGWIGSSSVKGVFLPSSGAVYAALGTAQDRDGRAIYGADKLNDEAQFAAACRTGGARHLVARIFSLSGPHINKHGAYVLAGILLSILKRRPVVLRAQRPVYRSYIGVSDLVSVALAWLLAGTAPEQLTIDAASDEVVELGALAQRAIEALDASGIPLERPQVDASDPDRYLGDAAGMARLAGVFGQHLSPLKQQIIDTAAFLAEAVDVR